MTNEPVENVAIAGYTWTGWFQLFNGIILPPTTKKAKTRNKNLKNSSSTVVKVLYDTLGGLK